MAYKITQHRRGTEAEWLSYSSVVPFEGELIIVEFENSLCKCKIGDGIKTFLELPYITDWLADKLIEELGTLHTQTKSELTEEVSKLEQKLEENNLGLSEDLEELRSDVASQLLELNTDLATISADLAKVDGVIKTLVEPAVGALDAKYSEELSKITTKHEADVTGLRETFTSRINESTQAIELLANQVITDRTAAIARAKDEIEADYLAKVTAAENRIQTDINELDLLIQDHTSEILDLQTELDTVSSDLADLIDDKIIVSENTTEAKLEDIREAIGQIYLTIEQLKKDESSDRLPEFDQGPGESISNEALVQLVNQLDELQYKVSVLENSSSESSADLQKIDIELKRLAASLTLLIDQQKLSSETFNNVLNNLDARLSKADSDIMSIVISHTEEITADLSTLHSMDDQLYLIIYRIRDELLKKISKAQTALEETISTNISELEKSINDTKTTFSEELKTTRSNLNTSIEEVKTYLVNKVNTLDKKHKQDIAEHENALNELDTTITTNEVEFTSKLDALTLKVNTNKANINSTNSAIQQVTTTFDDKTRLLKANIDNLDAQLEQQSNRISNLVAFDPEHTFNAEYGYVAEKVGLEVADARLGYGSVAEAITELNKNLSNDIQDLDTRLSQHVATPVVDGLLYDYTGEHGLMQPYMLYLTTNNEVIKKTGVRIISGADGGGGVGGGSMSSLKLGYITPQDAKFRPTDKAILRFTFSGTDSSGDTIRRASAKWEVGDETVYGYVTNGENEFDITKYLSAGSSLDILLTVTDANRSVITKSWTIELLELSVTSSFNDKRTYQAGKPIPSIEFIPEGIPSNATDARAIFKLDGVELDPFPLKSTASGIEQYYPQLPAQSHGSHLLEIYIEVPSADVVSEPIFKDILWYDSSTSNSPVIGTTVQDFEAKQYSTTNIVYTVYDPNAEIPTVNIEIDGDIVATTLVKLNTDYNSPYYNTPTTTYSYKAEETGAHTIKICCGNTSKTINVFVEDIGIDIAPVTAGLVFDFNPVGHNNGDSWVYNDVHLYVSDGFDWENGGYKPDDPDGPCFCIKAGSSATIDYKLFEEDAKVNGKNFKLIFKTKNVSNPNAVFLSCVDNTTAKDHVGITMGVHSATIYGKNGQLDLAYSEEDVIEFEFNISKETSAIPMVMGYEDGVSSRPMVYNSTHAFKQETPKEITLGSADCDLYIYRFKVYDTTLSAVNILNNYIADARTTDEMLERYNRNQIYDSYNKLTPETLAKKCPWLRVYTVAAPHFTSDKSDKVPNTTIRQIYTQGDPVLDNWTCYNAQHSGQGTSSNNYAKAGRNLDFIMNTPEAYFEYGDGTTSEPGQGTITLTRNSIPVNYLNAKVNIASSNNLTNAILAKRYNQFNPYRRPFVREENYPISDIKDTMEFYNCVIFIKETDPDLSTHLEFADNDWHFYAIGNIGDSKKTDKTRLTDQSDPYECCVEIMDVELPLSDFPRDTMITAMGYTTNEETSEIIYTWAKPENLGILYELINGQYIKTPDTKINLSKTYYVNIDGVMTDAMEYTVDEETEEKTYTWAKQENLGILYELIDGSYVKTEDTEIDLTKTYYVDILEHDDFSEDYTYGWRYISNKKDESIIKICKQAWIDFYRFVTTSTDAEFKANLKNYFVIDSALYYYLFTTRYCMVDNRAKNTFWHYSKTRDLDAEGNPIRKWDLCWDYDNDTSLGLDNYGKQVYRYGLEDFDVDENGVEIFRESDSTFFCRIRDCFAAELEQMYNDLESGKYSNGKNAWHAESFLQECDDWQNEFPEELWRLDIERKYIRTYNASGINKPGEHMFLVDMSHGRQKYHRRQWERSQEKYMASKYKTSTSTNDKVIFRCASDKGDSAFDLSYDLNITPYAYMYINTTYSDVSGAPITQRRAVQPGVPVSIPYPGGGKDISVHSASLIQSLGDLSKCYPHTVIIGNASRLRSLQLGDATEGYVNPGFTTLTTGANNLIKELDISNISGLDDSLDLRAMINLEEFYATGTNIPSILFAEGGKINTLALPAVNSLTLKNLAYLASSSLTLSCENITELTVEDCPLVDQLSLLEACINLATVSLRKVRLDNINFGTKTYEYFKNKIFGLKGVSVAGGETDDAQIIGTVHFENLTGAQFNELTRRYPKLTITSTLLTSTIDFKDTDLTTSLYSTSIENSGNCEDPVTSELITRIPVKDATQEFSYEWFGWSETPNIIVNYEKVSEEELEATQQADYLSYRVNCLLKVRGDRVLYPVFKATTRTYTVTFINSTASLDSSWYSCTTTEVPYGSDAKCPWATDTIRKHDVTDATLYAFIGWEPSNKVITGDTTCYAQFAYAKEATLTVYDISGEGLTNEFNQVISVGYTLNSTAETMSITACKPSINNSIIVPASLNIEGTNYSITSLGGFYNHTRLAHIKLPDTILSLLNGAFKSCINLSDIEMPAYLQSIGERCFNSCKSLTRLVIPNTVSSIASDAFNGCTKLLEFDLGTNTNFSVQSGCLIDNNYKRLLFGTFSPEVAIPTSSGTVTKLASYCFAGNNMLPSEFVIPANITDIEANAFSNCTSIQKVTFNNSKTVLKATSFAWCSNLKTVVLPAEIIDIPSYAFNGCALDTITIPASIASLGDKAFGELNGTTITIAEGVLLDSLTIHANAFGGSSNLTLNLPWTESEHRVKFTKADGSLEAWGAIKPITLNFIDGNTVTITA